jgi:hypothetical protein
MGHLAQYLGGLFEALFWLKLVLQRLSHMEPSSEHVDELKRVYRRETGKELSDEQAYDEVRRMIGLAELGLESYFKKMNHKNEPE